MATKHRLQFQGNNVSVDSSSWTTDKPVVDGLIKGDVVLLIFDYTHYSDNKVARNLEGFTVDGKLLWIAENPVDTANEAYAEFIEEENNQSGNTVEVGDLAGFRCTVDINTGQLVNVVFTK
ncbi:MAG: hypothetical protein PVG89_16225 [Gammaproteobacteria bacterium]